MTRIAGGVGSIGGPAWNPSPRPGVWCQVRQPISASDNVVDRDLFTFILHHEIHKATRLQYCVSLVCLTPDLPRPAVKQPVLQRLARLSGRELRATDLVASVFPASVALLLINADSRALPTILERLRERVEPVARVPLRAGGGCYPETATTGTQLLQQAIELMARAKTDRASQLYLPS